MAGKKISSPLQLFKECFKMYKILFSCQFDPERSERDIGRILCRGGGACAQPAEFRKVCYCVSLGQPALRGFGLVAITIWVGSEPALSCSLPLSLCKNQSFKIYKYKQTSGLVPGSTGVLTLGVFHSPDAEWWGPWLQAVWIIGHCSQVNEKHLRAEQF